MDETLGDSTVQAEHYTKRWTTLLPTTTSRMGVGPSILNSAETHSRRLRSTRVELKRSACQGQLELNTPRCHVLFLHAVVSYSTCLIFLRGSFLVSGVLGLLAGVSVSDFPPRDLRFFFDVFDEGIGVASLASFRVLPGVSLRVIAIWESWITSSSASIISSSFCGASGCRHASIPSELSTITQQFLSSNSSLCRHHLVGRRVHKRARPSDGHISKTIAPQSVEDPRLNLTTTDKPRCPNRQAQRTKSYPNLGINLRGLNKGQPWGPFDDTIISPGII